VTDTTADPAPTGRPERSRIERYDPSAIEPRWQQRWDELALYHTDLGKTRERYYLLTMYPYPSGDIHIGHWYIKTPTDALARFRRMHGKNVFLPIGFDAFGLPAENAAIKNRINPRDWTMSNIDNMRRQLRQMGATFDWSAEVVTSDPDYYRWNQWFFLQFLKAGPRAERSCSRPRHRPTTRAARSCACSRRARTRCSVQRSWSSRPSTRSSRR